MALVPHEKSGEPDPALLQIQELRHESIDDGSVRYVSTTTIEFKEDRVETVALL